jgi:hypothetical protein
MAIRDTGLEVYESAMRPVRQNIQAIFAHQAKQKADAESERRQLELEQRAERRQMELESRAEERVISTEARRKAEEDSDDMAAAVAAAGRYGLPTEGRTPEQLQQDVEKEVAKKVPRDFLMANMDVLPGILDQEKISAIQNNALSEGELAQIKANVEGRITASRTSDAEMWLRKTPQRLADVENGKKLLTKIAEDRAEIYGAPLADAARRAILAAIPQDGSVGNESYMLYRKRAAQRAVEDSEIQDIFSRHDRLRVNFASNPGAVILNAAPINSNGDKLDSMDDEDKMLLLEAWQRGQASQAAATADDQEKDYWRRESLLKAAHEARNPMSRQLEFLKQQEFKIYDRLPELSGWNSQQQKVMPPPVKATTTDSRSDGASSGFGNAMQRLQAAPSNSTPAAEAATAPATELVASEEPVAAEEPTEEEPAAATVPPAASIAVEDLGQDMGSPFGGTSANLISTPELAAPSFSPAATAAHPLLSPYAKSSTNLATLLDQKAAVDAEIQAMKDLKSGKTKVPSFFGIPLHHNQIPVVNWNRAISERDRLQLLIDAERNVPVPDLSERGDVVPHQPPAPDVTPSLRTPETGANVGSNLGQYEQAVQAQMGQAPPPLGRSMAGNVQVTEGDPYGGYRELLSGPRIHGTPFSRYVENVINRMGPWERYQATKAFNEARPPIGNEPWMQEHRRSQLPPPQPRTLPTQPTWQTY